MAYSLPEAGLRLVPSQLVEPSAATTEAMRVDWRSWAPSSPSGFSGAGAGTYSVTATVAVVSYGVTRGTLPPWS